MNRDIGPNPPAESPNLNPPDQPLKILLIEDHAGDARLIQLMLSEAGRTWFELERVDRLSAGLSRLAKGGIGLVLLDLSLPDSHGLDTFVHLHEHVPEIPTIVMSGLNDETLAVNAVHQGAQDYLVKGHVDGLLLVRSIRYAVERKRIQEQLQTVAQQLREKNAQLEADLQMARDIQQIFLPRQYPSFPRSARLEESALQFHHCYQPAAAVSGDFFNIFPISDSVAGLFICDVMGHGLRAALVTAILRGLIEKLMPVAADPGCFLTELNRSLLAILHHTDEPLLATAFYLVADVANAKLTFASAGHPSPLRLMPGSASAQPLRYYDPRHGPALGLFEAAQFPTCSSPVAEHDMFVLFTDGLYEVEGPNHQEYGQEKLLEAVRQRIGFDPPLLFKSLLAEVQDTAQTTEFADDVCLVAMQVRRLGSSLLHA